MSRSQTGHTTGLTVDEKLNHGTEIITTNKQITNNVIQCLHNLFEVNYSQQKPITHDLVLQPNPFTDQQEDPPKIAQDLSDRLGGRSRPAPAHSDHQPY